MNSEGKNLEIIEGDGSNINMSPVSDYIVSIQPKNRKSKKLVVPEEKKIHKNKKDK